MNKQYMDKIIHTIKFVNQMVFRLGTHLRTLRELIFFLIQHRLPSWGGPPTTHPTTNRWTDKIFDLKLQYLLSSRIDKIKIKCQIPFAMFFSFRAYGTYLFKSFLYSSNISSNPYVCTNLRPHFLSFFPYIFLRIFSLLQFNGEHHPP